MSRFKSLTLRARQGIALPAVLFLIVIVGLMLSAGLAMLSQSQNAFARQVQSARALAAASSATEWGAWKVLDPTASQGLDATTLPPCIADTTLALPDPLAGMNVQLSCQRLPATGSIDEGGLKLVFYRLVATVDNGQTGTAEAVRRSLEVRVGACKNPGGTAPLYSC
jgi:type II secretory pathway pseudopilin PulG